MEVNLPCKCSGLWFLTKASLNFNTDRSAYTLKFVKIFNSSKLKTLVLSADTSFVGRGYLTGRVRPKKLLIHLMYLFFLKFFQGWDSLTSTLPALGLWVIPLLSLHTLSPGRCLCLASLEREVSWGCVRLLQYTMPPMQADKSLAKQPSCFQTCLWHFLRTLSRNKSSCFILPFWHNIALVNPMCKQEAGWQDYSTKYLQW